MRGRGRGRSYVKALFQAALAHATGGAIVRPPPGSRLMHSSHSRQMARIKKRLSARTASRRVLPSRCRRSRYAFACSEERHCVRTMP